MKNFEILKHLKLAALTAFCFSLLSLNAFAQTPNPGDIVIAEIGADPPSGVITTAEPHAEYFVLCNRTTTTFNLQNMTVTDNASTIVLPAYSLTGNACVVVIASANGTGVFGPAPGGYGCGETPTNAIIFTTGTWFSNQLSNTADRLGLFSGATLIDGVSYGSDTTYLNPPAPDVFNNSGTTLVRVGYPGTSPSLLPDTNTAADFTSRAGTPCDAPRGAATAASVSIGGRVLGANNRPVFRALVYLTDQSGETKTAVTNAFGYYRFQDVNVGQTYTVNVLSKRYLFEPQVLTINEEIDNLNFLAQP
ncbi:MAG: carboxypeptidase regulatory-like domain-containing protein [Acidobacteriota bacterium]|nr:carboxypeptidase regulatory-like domain-containing protein [Acidobacteriota bacterium]